MIPEIRFVDRPAPTPRADYQDLERSVLENLEGRPWVRALATFGSLNNPGISDLDILVVCRDRVSGLGAELAELKKNAGGELAHLLDVTLINDSILPTFHHYGYVPSATWHVGGSMTPDEELTAEAQVARGIGALAGVLSIRWHYLTRQILERKIRLRRTLLALNSIRYGVGIVEALTGQEEAYYKTFLEDVQRLRKHWFDEDPDTRQLMLLELMQRGIRVSRELLLDGARILHSHSVFTGTGSAWTLEPRTGTFISFTEKSVPGLAGSDRFKCAKVPIEDYSQWRGTRRRLALGPVLELPQPLGLFCHFMVGSYSPDMLAVDYRGDFLWHRHLITAHRSFLQRQGMSGGAFSIGNLLWRSRHWKSRILTTPLLRKCRLHLATTKPALPRGIG